MSASAGRSRQADEQAVDLLARAGWDRDDIDQARAVCLSRHGPAQFVTVGSLGGVLARAGVSPAEVLLFLRLSPAADVEQVATLGQGQPVRFVCQCLICGVHPTKVAAVWDIAMGLGLPQDGFDAAGWVATGLLRGPRARGKDGVATVEAAIRPWVQEFGPGAWRWLLQDVPPSLDRARSESVGWGRDRENLDFILAMQGAYDRTALVDPPPLGLPPVTS